MPLNALIPMSFEAPDLPDVNAMMQTRAQGMANIVDIERQRAADAQAAQEAQQEATIQSLIPAYAYGIQTGDMTGAMALVPSEMRENLAPYVQELQGKSPEQVRSALIGSLSTSKAGQAALAAMQRAQTAGIQQQQAQTAASRLAWEQSQAGVPKPMSEYEAARVELARGEQAARKTKETADEVKKRLSDEKRAVDLDLAIGEVQSVMKPGGLIDQATGSYIGNLVDTAAATVGVGTGGAEATAKLAPIADLVLKMVPRFEGPQSNFDVQSYKDAAGNLANPNVPASVKKAAATEIVRLFQKYRDQFEYAGGAMPSEGRGGAGGAEPATIDFGDLGD